MMTKGYDKPLYILPFDHRHSYGSEVFGFHEPMSPEQIAVVADSKQLIYEGYQQALAAGVRPEHSGILVDEEFGASILCDAKRRGYLFAMPTEKSGQHEFDFEYGDNFARHLEEFDPTFTKVLVRYNPEGDQVENKRQTAQLKRLSDYLIQTNRLFMYELLVPPEPAQLEKLKGNRGAYDATVRPGLMIRAIHAMQDAGVEPDVWKIEGLYRREDCERIVAAVRRDGRDRVACVVLGRGEDEAKVIEWLRIAATVPGFIGFAVGRSSFLEAIVDWRAGKISRADAVAHIAAKFEEWVDVFEQARARS